MGIHFFRKLCLRIYRKYIENFLYKIIFWEESPIYMLHKCVKIFFENSIICAYNIIYEHRATKYPLNKSFELLNKIYI